MLEATVIICHHKGDLIRDTLKSLYKSDISNFSTFVVSSFYLRDPLIVSLRKEFPKVSFLQHDGGPAEKRNYAFKYVHSKFLVFFDDDVELKPDTLRELIEANKHDRTGMVFGKLYNAEFRNRLDEAGGFLTWTGFIWSRAESNIIDIGQFQKFEPIFAGKSASCSIKTDLFKAIGGFDESFGILGEESDLAWRVWLSGHLVMFDPKSIAYHKFNTRFKPKDFYTNDRVYYNGCRNYITMLFKNLEARNLWIVPVHTVAWIVSAFGMLLGGKFLACKNILRGIWYVVSHLPLLLRKRKKVQRTRVLKDKELFSIILKQPKFSYYYHRLLRYWSTGLHG